MAYGFNQDKSKATPTYIGDLNSVGDKISYPEGTSFISLQCGIGGKTVTRMFNVKGFADNVTTTMAVREMVPGANGLDGMELVVMEFYLSFGARTIEKTKNGWFRAGSAGNYQNIATQVFAF